MRRWLLDLHLYLGLLCLPYVVVFGISSILLNHRVERVTQSEWSERIAPLAEAPAARQAEAAIAALGLRASALGHTLKHDAAGALSFRAIRTGRSYQVTVGADGAARVVERHGGVLGAINGLHGMHDREPSWWHFGWSLYTELATGVLLFAIASGVLLVLPRPSGRALALGAGALGSVALAALGAAIW
jgi:hypothetical protein